MKNGAAFLAGLVFALGLGISGMTQPAKVAGFLDFFGKWDPSLMFVMGGAIAAHFLFVRRALAGGAPRFADRYEWPRDTKVTVRLLSGAAIFGVGWGITGLCPGPALVSLFGGAKTTIAFVVAMLATIAVYRAASARATDVAAA
jgi:uncharacterized membrane protein YedE/YeeE